jgi:hypothetical protein
MIFIYLTATISVLTKTGAALLCRVSQPRTRPTYLSTLSIYRAAASGSKIYSREPRGVLPSLNLDTGSLAIWAICWLLPLLLLLPTPWSIAWRPSKLLLPLCSLSWWGTGRGHRGVEPSPQNLSYLVTCTSPCILTCVHEMLLVRLLALGRLRSIGALPCRLSC